MRIIKWTCTDPDSYQWRGDYDDGVFLFFDTVVLPDGFAVASEEIDLADYDDESKKSALDLFGYKLDEVDDALLAECIFEHEYLFCPYNWENKYDNERKARSYIDRQMDFYGGDLDATE